MLTGAFTQSEPPDMGLISPRPHRWPRVLAKHYGHKNTLGFKTDRNGRRLCQQCVGPLPAGNRTYCTPYCARLHVLTARQKRDVMRLLVWKRDAGVCAECGLDTAATQQRLTDYENRGLSDAAWAELYRVGFTVGISLWQADHITAVSENGGMNDLGNYQTLCVPCHKHDNALLAIRARERETGQLSLSVI